MPKGGRRLRIGIWLRVTSTALGVKAREKAKESGHETSRRDTLTDFCQKKIIRGAREGLKKKTFKPGQQEAHEKKTAPMVESIAQESRGCEEAEPSQGQCSGNGDWLHIQVKSQTIRLKRNPDRAVSEKGRTRMIDHIFQDGKRRDHAGDRKNDYK